MKFLLMVTLLLGSIGAYAQPNGNDWEIKCYEKDGHELDLAYIIKVGHNDPTMMTNWKLQLEDCTYDHDDMSFNCRERGYLRKEERQDEVCLELKHHDDVKSDSWSLCYEEQETITNPRKLVPVTVNDDNQDSRIYCEREILKILR